MERVTPTQGEFDKFLRWLDGDRDTAGEKYAKIQFRLIRIFSCRGCSDSEDLADRTINVVISKIDWLMENYVGDPSLYFYAVAKRIYLDGLKPKPPQKLPPPKPDAAELEEISGYLDECLQSLSAADKTLVLHYHEGEKQEKIQNRKRLADRLKVSQNALRIRVYHLHSRLRECIESLKQEPRNA